MALIKNAGETEKTSVTNGINSKRPKRGRLVYFVPVTLQSLCERAVQSEICSSVDYIVGDTRK
jgi:hypothetical protein